MEVASSRFPITRHLEALLLDLDAERIRPLDTDRRFRIGGVEFTHKATVGANVMARFMDSPEAVRPVCPHCGETFAIGSIRPQQDALQAADEFILALLEPGQEEKWAQVRADDAPDPLTPREVQQVGWQLIGAITARPTESPSGSSSTSNANGTSSTDRSHAPAAA